MSGYKRLNLNNGDIVNSNVFTHIDDTLETLYDASERILDTPGVNINDLTNFEQHHGFILSTGVWGNINEKYQHVVIPISGANAVLKMSGNGERATYYAGVKTYNINEGSGAMLDFSDDENWNKRLALSTNGTIDTKIPNDVKYLILLTTNNTSNAFPKDFSLISEDGGSLLTALKQRLDNIETKVVNWIALGDSITEGFYSVYNEETNDYDCPRAKENSWVSTVAKLKGFNLTNKGVGGSGWLKRGSTQAPKLNAREQIDAVNEDGSYVLDFANYDLCTIAWGVNDWKGKSNLGTFEDGINPEVESVYGNIRYCLETIQKRNPNMKIIVISPIQCAIGSSSYEGNYAIGTTFEGLTLVDFYDAIKECCEYYGIQFIDMLYSGVVNRLNITTLLPDRVHPSLQGHILIGRELAGKISYGN